MIKEIFYSWCCLGIIALLVIGVSILSSCKSDMNTADLNLPASKVTDSVSSLSQSITTQKTEINYNVAAITKIALPKNMLEISGLTIDASDDNLYAVNDEKGILFQLNKDGKIISQFDFGKDGDYEGIEKVGNSIFILKSNGKIIEFDLIKSEKVGTFNNPLSLENDAEGLGFDASSHSLLIACKGSPNIKGSLKLKKTKAVYAFDLKSKQLLETPIITITDEHIAQFMKTRWKNELSKKKYKTKLHRATNFSPSAIALNTIDGYYYLLSTLGKTLLVADRYSEIKSIYFLDDKAYIQPEGICFDKSGIMWVSNEGKGLESNMLQISLLN